MRGGGRWNLIYRTPESFPGAVCGGELRFPRIQNVSTIPNRTYRSDWQPEILAYPAPRYPPQPTPPPPTTPTNLRMSLPTNPAHCVGCSCPTPHTTDLLQTATATTAVLDDAVRVQSQALLALLARDAANPAPAVLAPVPATTTRPRRETVISGTLGSITAEQWDGMSDEALVELYRGRSRKRCRCRSRWSSGSRSSIWTYRVLGSIL